MSTSLITRRAVWRAVPRSRGASLSAEQHESVKRWAEQQTAQKVHAAETTALWKRISFYVCLPAILVTTLWVRKVEAEHAEHTEHLKAEHGGGLPPTPEYEYLNRRARGPFPWGMNSLFFNPRVNKDMSQQEDA